MKHAIESFGTAGYEDVTAGALVLVEYTDGVTELNRQFSDRMLVLSEVFRKSVKFTVITGFDKAKGAVQQEWSAPAHPFVRLLSDKTFILQVYGANIPAVLHLLEKISHPRVEGALAKFECNVMDEGVHQSLLDLLTVDDPEMTTDKLVPSIEAIAKKSNEIGKAAWKDLIEGPDQDAS